LPEWQTAIEALMLCAAVFRITGWIIPALS
jgi:hypothetical protein